MHRSIDYNVAENKSRPFLRSLLRRHKWENENQQQSN